MKKEINHQAILLRKLAEKILDGRPDKPEFNLSPIDMLKLIHELEVHQIELEMQNDELGLRNEAIDKEKSVSQTATAKYLNLYDHAPTGYFVITSEGEIIDLNLNAAKKLGVEQKQLLKKRFGLFVSEDTRPKFNDFLEKIYENKSTESCQVVLTSKTQETIHVHITGELYEEMGLCFLSVIDITSRIEHERHREITQKILQLLNEPGNMQDTVHRALSELKSFTGYDAIGIRLKVGDDFPYFDQIGFPAEFLITENTLLEYDLTGKLCRDNGAHPNLACTCGLVLSGNAEPSNPLMTEGGSWWVNDSSTLVDLPEHLDARFRPRNHCIYQGYSSIVLIPIRHNSTIIGLIQFNDQQKNRFNRTTVEHLEEIASHFGAAMLRKQAEEALRISEEKFRNLVWGMQAGILLFTPGFEVIQSNPKAFELLGTDLKQHHEISFFYQNMNVIHDDGTAFLQEDQPVVQVIATGKPVRDCIMGVLNLSTGERNWLLVQAEPQVGKDGKIQQVICTFIDISELKKKDDALKKLNLTLAALSKSSQAMVHSMNETDYLDQVCKIVREDCGYAMIWIGFKEENEAKNIKPVANAGFEDGYLETILLSWDDNVYGRGPTGKAIRTGQTSICTDMLTDPTYIPWRKDALKRGYSSSISIPLLNSDIVFGAITIYSGEIDPFSEDEVKLLNELANDLAYGITAIRLRKAHQDAQNALSTSFQKLEEVVKLRTSELVVKNEQLNAEIKNRIQQEQHLKRAEEKYRTVADFTYNMETWIDTLGKYIYVSPSSKTVTGYRAEEFMNDPELLIKIAHPDDSTLVEHHFNEKNRGQVSNCSMDFRIITPEGEVRWVGHTCQKVFNVDGKWIGQRGSNRDITTQKNEELNLIESKKHLRALTHRMDVVAEEERIRISREIHDELGHLLTALKYDMEGLKNTSGLTMEMVKSELSALNSMIDSLIDSVRKIATELRPGILDHLGIFPAIEWKIKQFRMRNKICCEYQIEEMDLEFNKEETTIIYRVLQEIFTNISQHSQAKRLWISIYKSEGYFIMKVSDDGIGFVYNSSLQTGSLGLLGMNERAMSIGGQIDIVSAPGLGTTVTFSLKK